MEKSKTFDHVIFDSEFISKAIDLFMSTSGCKDFNRARTSLRVSFNEESIRHDTLEEFLADYQKKEAVGFYLALSDNGYEMSIALYSYESGTAVDVKAPTRHEMERLFNLFEQNANKFRIKILKPKPKSDIVVPHIAIDTPHPVVFIGHGADTQWRDLKDYLHDMLKIEVEAYEAAPRANHSIKDILAAMAVKPTFAVLVFTGENEYKDGTLHARENVVHELGYFQGNISFNRTMVLLEEGTDYFTNIDGIQQVRFDKGNIKAAFGEVLATLKREFGKI